MIWITLVSFVSVLLTILLWKGAAVLLSKFPSLVIGDSVIDLVIDYARYFFVSVLVMWLLGMYMVSYQITEMYTCSVRGTVQKVETQYTWYFDKCQFMNKNGVYVDFDKVRGTPGDSEDESN